MNILQHTRYTVLFKSEWHNLHVFSSTHSYTGCVSKGSKTTVLTGCKANLGLYWFINFPHNYSDEPNNCQCHEKRSKQGTFARFHYVSFPQRKSCKYTLRRKRDFTVSKCKTERLNNSFIFCLSLSLSLSLLSIHVSSQAYKNFDFIQSLWLQLRILAFHTKTLPTSQANWANWT